MLLHRLVQAGLEDGAVAVLQGFELFEVLLDASDSMSDAGQTCAGDEADIPAANDGYIHSQVS